ncbi:MAG: hypothetical protein QNL68_13975 [Akkermansiaceae bacterium]|jgi:hypothetical protein
MFLKVSGLAISLVIVLPCAAEWTLSDMIGTGSDPIYRGRPMEERFLNPWPAGLEAEFQKRARGILSAQVRDNKPSANTYFENEKRTYGFVMAHILAGKREEALKVIQGQDHQHEVWHRETDGIDYYACFTLKHQMRKYFYFGDLLDPEYKRLMFTGGKKWTVTDPLRKPHYAYAKATGWGPDAMNSWVDVRSTENLYLMRVTSVYLMAEETGNKETTALYKDHLLNYAKTLYRVGIGEWDSENYHGHSVAPLLNVYDFAKDPEVKSAAKACLDFFAAAGAVKYYRGGFNGPTKRDYNHAQPFGGSAANSLWVWFGDHPSGKMDHWESDEVHQITSAYRPPLAVVELARKHFERPLEIFAAKPSYSATTTYQFESKPEYAETQYLAHSYQMGSLTGGISVDGGDVNGFKILAFDEENGAVALQAAPSLNPAYPGSPMYQKGIVPFENRVAQQENLVLWLAKSGTAPWLWVVPGDVEVTVDQGVTFLKCDRTWVAVHPLGTSELKADPGLTGEMLEFKEKRFPGHQVLSCRGDSKSFCGMAIQTGEKESHGSFEKFKAAVLASELDLSELDQGIVRCKTPDGKHLGIHWSDDPLDLGVWRNGKRRDLKNPALYESPVIKAAGDGTLTVEAGGHRFQATVDESGHVVFSNN